MSRFIPIISVFLLFFIVLGGYYFWLPEYEHFQDLRLALAKKQVQLERAEEYLLELKALSGRLTGYEDEFVKVDSALPLDPSIPSLFDFIQKTSSENGLVLESISSGRSGPLGEERVQRIPFSITVFGSYSGFKDFLSAVYKNSRIIDVSSVDFSSFSTSEEETGLFVFSLKLKTHSY